MVNFNKNQNNAAKVLAVLSVLFLFFVGNTSSVLAYVSTFFRTIALDSNPLPGYGYGYGFNGSYGYGYGYDTVPDAFSFTALTGKELSTSYESNTVTINSINKEVSVSIVGGEYQIVRNITGANFGFDTAYATPEPTWTTASGTAYEGDVIKVRLTSSASYSTLASATLTVGGTSATFNVTTKAYSGGGGSGGGGGGYIQPLTSNTPTQVVTTTKTEGDKTTKTTTDGRKTTTTTTVGGSTTTVVTMKTPSGITVPMIPQCGLISQKDILTEAQLKLLDSRDNWAKAYIYRLAMRGTIDNVDAFRPNDRVTRAEFLKMVMTAAGCVPTAGVDVHFTDVAKDSWYAPYVSLALSAKVISSDFTTFRPNDYISRGEASKIIAGLFKLNLSNVKTYSFTDLDLTTDLARYIEASKRLGFFAGQIVDGKLTFRPNDSILRSEVAKVIVDTFGL